MKKPQRTAQRAVIRKFLTGNASHPSVTEIYEAVSQGGQVMSLATVYNTLTLFKRQGLVRELPAIGGEGRRFDPNASPHDHLVCSACGAVVDVDLPHSIEIPEAQKQGFDILGLSITMHGLCPRCKSGEDKPKPPRRKAGRSPRQPVHRALRGNEA